MSSAFPHSKFIANQTGMVWELQSRLISCQNYKTFDICIWLRKKRSKMYLISARKQGSM